MAKQQSRVILWAAPRTLSTAFERSMRTLSHCKVFHEPFGYAYYFGPDRPTQSFGKIIDAQVAIPENNSYENTSAMIMKDFPEFEALFIKEHAFFVEDKLEQVLKQGLSSFTHTFLIRRPDKAICSLYTCGQTMPGWTFEPMQAGFKSLYNFYKHMQQVTDKPLLVIDADDLLSAPDEMMEAYCNAVGIRYNPGMTSWEPGMIHDWSVVSEWWTDHWYTSVAATSGFIRRVGSEQDLKEPVIPSDLPEEVSACIRESWPLYQEMRAARIVPKL